MIGGIELQELAGTDTVALNAAEDAVVIIDQTCLPNEFRLLELREVNDMRDAIRRLAVRGAPAIGVFAALSMYVLSKTFFSGASKEEFFADFKKAKTILNGSRPTAVNLSWALNRMEKALLRAEAKLTGTFVTKEGEFRRGLYKSVDAKASGGSGEGQEEIATVKETAAENVTAEGDGIAKETAVEAAAAETATAEAPGNTDFREWYVAALRKEAVSIYEEDIEVCRRIGSFGVDLINPGDGILTHCNAGRLATIRYGTATAPMYMAKEKGYKFRVYCDETRPLLQGARLTALELTAAGMDTTLICDSMSAGLMKKGRIKAVFVGCDRVALNGDVANKVGTGALAVLARHYGIPFYVCAPLSSVDPSTSDGDYIEIEERSPEEVTELWFEKRMAPEGVKVYNPAFDITDHSLITAFVTEEGLVLPPFEDNLASLLKKKGR